MSKRKSCIWIGGEDGSVDREGIILAISKGGKWAKILLKSPSCFGLAIEKVVLRSELEEIEWDDDE